MSELYWNIKASFILGSPPIAGSAFRLPVDVLHVYFEVVIPGELLVAQLALRHGPVGVVRQLVPAEHLLQAKRQVAHLQEHKTLCQNGPFHR